MRLNKITQYGVFCLLALVALGGIVRAVEVSTQEVQDEGGVIMLSTENGAVNEWTYKATRWGMYDVIAYVNDFKATGKVVVTANDQTLELAFPQESTDPHRVEWLVGRVYLPTAGPQKLAVQAPEMLGVGGLILEPAPEGKPVVQADDGSVILHAKDATVHGTVLRYEPKKSKNCLGFWRQAGDYASWTFESEKAGVYDVIVHQGCGTGQGGSQMILSSSSPLDPTDYADQTQTFEVKDTGGFQKFVAIKVGAIKMNQPGEHTINLKPLVKAANAKAVMDLQYIELTPRK